MLYVRLHMVYIYFVFNFTSIFKNPFVYLLLDHNTYYIAKLLDDLYTYFMFESFISLS